MRVAIYARVSTIDKGQTLEQQEEPLIKFCQENHAEYTLFKDYASGSKESRPQLDLMLQAFRQRKYDTLLVFRLDRLGRSLKHLLQVVEELNNLKVRIIFYTQDIDSTTPQGMFFLQITAIHAEFERQLIRERIKDKLRYIDDVIKKDGHYVSKAGNKITKRGRPFGAKDKKDRRRSGYWLRWHNQHKKKNINLSLTNPYG